MSRKFPWGLKIEYVEYNFDGKTMTVTKYHPWDGDGCTILTGIPNLSQIMFHCEELRESSSSLHYLMISWIAKTNIGYNQHALSYGLAKALDCFKGESQ